MLKPLKLYFTRLCVYLGLSELLLLSDWLLWLLSLRDDFGLLLRLYHSLRRRLSGSRSCRRVDDLRLESGGRLLLLLLRLSLLLLNLVGFLLSLHHLLLLLQQLKLLHRVDAHLLGV